MKDTEMRGLLLKKYYEHRHERMWYPNEQDVGNQLTRDDIFNISQQLHEKGLLDWNPLPGARIGMGHITADGVDIIEGKVLPPTFIEIKNYSVSGTNYGVVGDNSTQNIEMQISSIVSAIDNSSATVNEKIEAKGLFKKFLEHPLVCSLAGAALERFFKP